MCICPEVEQGLLNGLSVCPGGRDMGCLGVLKGLSVCPGGRDMGFPRYSKG